MDFLASQYHLSLADAFWRFPLRLALALLPWGKRRLGYDVQGPDNAVDAGLKARERMKALLRGKFAIGPPPHRRKPPLNS